MPRTSSRAGYDLIDADDYGSDLSETDFIYTWESFQDVRELYVRSAAGDRFVLFTADQ